METDREILMWFHERLVHVHGERENYDYMRRLRCIIVAQPPKKMSRDTGNCNNSFKEGMSGIKRLSPLEKVWLDNAKA